MTVETHGLAGAYAVDALDDAERAAFESHLGTCADCRAETASLRRAAAELGALAATPPPADLKDSVMAGVRSLRPLPPLPAPDEESGEADGPAGAGARDTDRVVALDGRRRPARTRPLTWLVAAAAAAAVVVGGLAWSPWSNDAPPGPTTVAERVLRAGDATRVRKTIDGATAVVVLSRSVGRAVIETEGMPPAPTGKDYQLWLQEPDGSMRPAGLMPRDGASSQAVALEGNASEAVGVGITVEPTGGSPQPTSPPVALFELGA